MHSFDQQVNQKDGNTGGGDKKFSDFSSPDRPGTTNPEIPCSLFQSPQKLQGD
jgi:hypothetical protein